MSKKKSNPLTKTEHAVLLQLTDDLKFVNGQRQQMAAYRLVNRKFAVFDFGVAQRDNVRGTTTLAPCFRITDEGKAYIRSLCSA